MRSRLPIGALVAAGLLGLASAASAGPALVGAQPVVGHPAVAPARPRTDIVRVLDGEVSATTLVGNRVVLGGTFTQVRDVDGTVYLRKYLVAYDQDTGRLDLGFDPVLDRAVWAVAPATDGASLYIGGEFSVVDGTARKKIAKLTTTGDLVTAFKANADNRVSDLVATPTRLYAGGRFGAINGAARARLAALDLTTGAVDPSFDLPLTEGLGRNGLAETAALDVTADYSTLMVAHTARRIGGQVRVGVGLVAIAGPAPTLSAWRTRLWEDAFPLMGAVYITDAEISADGSRIAVVSTGGDRPPTGDTAVLLPGGPAADGVAPTWVTRLFDSVYAVAVTDRAVYVGGHLNFAEAPGSAEPWPGETAINYGYGVDERGPAQLGDQVVRRGHLAALDLTTGKALPWNPGSDAFHGVVSLTAVPNGLLLGHDGDRVGGFANVGRAAFFDFRRIPAAENPDSTIDEPFNGRLVPGGLPIDVLGTATGSAGVQKVVVEVRDKTGAYMQANGSFASTAAGRNATLAAPGTTSTRWSITLPAIPAGPYTVTSRAIDAGGVREPSRTSISITVRPTDTTAPAVSGLSPAGETNNFTSNSIVVTGTAADNQGIASVRAVFFRADTDVYLQPDGTTAQRYAELSAILDTPEAASTGFRLPVTLPNGAWVMVLAAKDTAGLRTQVSARYFMGVGNQTPVAALTSPVRDQAFDAAAPLTLSGTATDDLAITEVMVLVQRLQDLRGLQRDGGFGEAQYFRVPFSPGRGAAVSWSYPVPALPSGTYQVLVLAYDEIRTYGFTYTVFDVRSPNDPLPLTTITTPAPGGSPAGRTFAIEGTATDNAGVASVAVSVQQAASPYHYLQPDGTWAPARASVPAALTTPNGASTAWSRSVTLDRGGSFYLYAIATDTAGQPSRYDGSVYRQVAVP